MNPDDAEQAQGNQKNHHRRDAFSGASYRSRKPVQDTQQKIERAEIPHREFAVGDCGRVVSEHTHQRIRKEKQQRSCGDGIKKSHGKSRPHAFFDPVNLPCAVILTGKCRDSHTEACDRQNIKAVDFHVSAEAGHGIGAEPVYAGLNQNIGERDDHVLDAGRKTDPDNAGRHFLLDADLAETDPVGGRNAHQKSNCEDTGDKLADIGGDSGSCDTHMESSYQKKVKYNIRDGSRTQIEQGTLGIADGVQNAGSHIVENIKHDAAEIDLQIGDGICQDILGRMHP